jgi:geranylgeranyl pyrophosphate synthase
MNFENHLQNLVKSFTLHPEMFKVFQYAIFPPGKLFRPNLGLALAQDLKQPFNLNLYNWLSAIEIHHAYSLVHDDLPCMDDDDIRRGKPSTHKAFGEWKALLAGDALLLHSLQVLLKIDTPHLALLQKIFFHATGARGLIQGQWIDLNLEAQNHFSDLIRMHELKTARLIELSLIGTWILLSPALHSQDVKCMFRLGSAIGLVFQLLDDLDDLAELKMNSHESEVNPFKFYSDDCFNELESRLKTMSSIFNTYQLQTTKKYLDQFLRNSIISIDNKCDLISDHLPLFDQKWIQFKSKNVFA